MKQLIFSLFVLLFAFTSINAQNKKTKEVIIHVDGICKMCKNRIEETSNFSKGVKSATWDKNTEKLIVIYKTNKISPQKIGEALAKAGHDNEFAKATDKQYKNLPACCKYKTQEKH